MTELLTESFCERCGTRYTFEATQRRRAGASRLRVLSLGLRTFIANDDTSLSEAMAAARNDEERAVAAQQMDAFHRTFNFCFSCRQYICANCWNDLAGTCLTCNPLEADRYEQSVPVEAAPRIAEPGTAASHALAVRDAAPWGAAPPAVEGSATGGTGSDQSPQGMIEAAGPTPLLRPRLEAVAWPRTDVAAPGADEGPAGAEVVIAPSAAEAPSATEALAESLQEEAAVEEASAAAGAPAEAVLAEATSADELTADELQTVREALGAVPGADSAGTLAVEAESPEAVAEPEAEAAAEPESVAVAEPEAEAAAEPEPVTPLASAPPPPEPEAPVLGSRTPAPGRAGTFGRLRTGGLLNRYRPAASDRLHATRPAPVAAEGAEPASAATGAGAAIQAAQGELVPDTGAATLPEPSRDLPAEPAPAAAEPAPPEAEPALSRGPAGAAPPTATPATRDVVSQPVWSVVAPDTDEEPAQPWTPEPRPAPRPLDLPPSAWAARLATARPNDVWTISAQDVVTTQAGSPAPSVQPCVQCGLALSANARFCRRCGAGQR